MPLARHGLEKDNARCEQVRGPTADSALDVLDESIETNPALAYTLVEKAADDRKQLPVGKAHGRRRMATVASAVARARRLDRCRGVHVVGVHSGWCANLGGQPQG